VDGIAEKILLALFRLNNFLLQNYPDSTVPVADRFAGVDDQISVPTIFSRYSSGAF
jgi:hypothetical protein